MPLLGVAQRKFNSRARLWAHDRTAQRQKSNTKDHEDEGDRLVRIDREFGHFQVTINMLKQDGEIVTLG